MNPNPRSATSFLMVPDICMNLLSRTYCLALSRPVRAGPTASAPSLDAQPLLPIVSRNETLCFDIERDGDQLRGLPWHLAGGDPLPWAGHGADHPQHPAWGAR